MGYARKLSDVLKEKNPNLYVRLEEIKKIAQKILTYTASGFPYYTPHDINHSENVEENLNWLIPDEIKLTLNPQEIFFLIVAAWMHDWGMVCKPSEKPEEVRKTHHVRTEQNFETMYEKLKLEKPEALIIGRISRGHRVEDVRGSLFEKSIIGHDIHIDIRFLTAVLRIADECDITYNRVPELIYFNLNPQGISEEHFKRHLQIQGIGKESDHKIKFYGIANDPKGSETLRQLRDKIQKEVDHVKGILAEKNMPIEYVDVQIDARGFVDKPIAFQLDENKITELLIGQDIYSRPDVAIRELLQNAVDACRLRKNVELGVQTRIRIYKENETIVIEDSGIGMDYELASNFLSKKGFSFYTSEELKKCKENIDFDPISRWGLGFLSCFLIAKSVEIETKSQDKEPCRFLIPSVGEGWRYEKGTRTESGTKITLILNERGLKLDLEKTLTYYVKSCETPLFYGKESEQPTNFEWTVKDPHLNDFLKTPFGETPQFDDAPIIYEDEQIQIKIYETKMFTVIENGFLTNQGFFVRNFPELPIPRNSVVLLNLKKDVLDLDISRDNVNSKTAKFDAFGKKWLDIFTKFMEDYIKKRSHNCKNSTIGQFFVTNLAIPKFGIFEFFSYLRAVEIEMPKFVKEFLMTFRFNLILNKKGMSLISFNDLISLKPKRILVYWAIMPLNEDEKYDNKMLDQEISFIESEIKDNLKDDDIVLFLANNVINSEEILKQIEHSLLEPIFKNAETEKLTIQTILNEKLIKVPHKLEFLLPNNGYFAKLPQFFSGCVICNPPFIVKSKTTLLVELAGKFVLGYYDKNMLEIIKNGTLIFDANDDFIQLLQSKVQEILDSAKLSLMVKNYFMFLTAKFFVSDNFPIDEFLDMKENEILSILNTTKEIKQYKNRLGNCVRVLDPTNISNIWVKDESIHREKILRTGVILRHFFSYV